MVSLFTTRFDTKNVYVLPTRCISVIEVVFKASGSYSPIQKIGFITKYYSVYYAVRAEFLNII